MASFDLKTNLNNKNIAISDSELLLLEKVMKNTIETNKVFNLTAITNEDEFLEKMIYDSIIGLPLFEKEGKKCIDVGTGAGFPGLPLAIMNPKNEYTLLDSTKKKIDFIQKFVDEEKLSNITTVNDRVENYSRTHREMYDYAFARAVSSLSILIETMIPLLKVGGILIAYKGKNAEEEIKQAKKAFDKLNCSLVKSVYETLPSSKEERYIVIIKKNKETNVKYPRDYSAIVSKPL